MTDRRRPVAIGRWTPWLPRWIATEDRDAHRPEPSPATITSVKLDDVMAEVVMAVGDVEPVAVNIRGSAETPGLEAADAVEAIIQSNEVMMDGP